MFDEIPPDGMGVIMAVVIATLRILYDRKETRPIRVILEAVLCGTLSLTASSGISALGLSADWAIFAGGVIGYFGADTVRTLAVRFLKNKTN